MLVSKVEKMMLPPTAEEMGADMLAKFRLVFQFLTSPSPPTCL